MTLVSISDAARMVGKTRAALYRDIEKGIITKTVLQDGDIRIDTAELARAYGPLPQPEAAPKLPEAEQKKPEQKKPEPKKAGQKKVERAPGGKLKTVLLEERIKALERVVALEAELRRVKDQVTHELRARLAEKDNLIKTLESKILFLEYDKQVDDVPTLSASDQTYTHEPETGSRRASWWSRILPKGQAARK